MKPPLLEHEGVTVYHGDALRVLRGMGAGTVDCVLTSPPYWSLRDYGDPDQLGLEATPELYIERLVEVFREAWRVLRREGTLWIVIGDSYAGGSSGDRALGDQSNPAAGRHRFDRARERPPVPGMKPKDLAGIPWRLAFALQEPYYTGHIRSAVDRAWLAAMVDAEGCIFIGRHRKGKATGRGGRSVLSHDQFHAGLTITSTSERTLERCREIAGVGNIRQANKVGGGNRRPGFEWRLHTRDTRRILTELYPHLVEKQQQARVAIHMPPSGDEAAAAFDAMKLLHTTGTSSVDAPPPPPCFEPGWYLRKDIVWAKPNAMPESVRDRPTSCHEHILMLSKNPRYYYDQEGCLEAYRYDGRRQTLITSNGVGTTHGNYANRPGHERWPRRRSGNLARKENHQDGDAAFGTSIPWEGDGGRNLRDVWTIPTEPTPLKHYATYPQALCDPVIRLACPAGGVVLDPFFGAGTTALVARRLGRRCIGVELSAESIRIAGVRLAMPDVEPLVPPDEALQLTLLGGEP